MVLNAGLASVVGVNYGLNGDNLPSPAQVIDLYMRCKIQALRLFDPNPDVLNALRGKPIVVSIGIFNNDIQSLATDPQAASSWVASNVMAYHNDVNIGYITVGNEVIPGAEAVNVLQAMNNMKSALDSQGLDQIKVTTVLSGASLAVSSPPSAGTFKDEVANVLRDIGQKLSKWGSPLMINLYPYFAYASEPQHISAEFALFLSQEPVVRDGDYEYYNLFDAMVDSFHAALEKIGASNVGLVISETGWPSAGNEPYTSKDNARTYNKNLMDHVASGKGTPRKPGTSFDYFYFAMFNENKKQAGVEQNFGFFYPNMEPVYPFW